MTTRAAIGQAGRIDARCTRVPGLFACVRGRNGAGSPPWEWRLDDKVDARLADLDRSGIRTQVLCPPTHVLAEDPSSAAGWLADLNDGLHTIATLNPERLGCFALIDFDDGTQGVGALESAISRGFRGAVVPTQHREHRLDEAFFHPFLRYAHQHAFPLLVRSTGLRGSGPTVDVRQQRNVGIHGDLGICLARMIFGRLFEEMPRLTLYLADGGGIVPGLVARLDHGYQVRKECRALLPRPPSSYLRHVYVDASGMDDALLSCAIKLLGATQIMFASGQGDCAAEIRRIESLIGKEVNAEGMADVFGGNAARFFGCGGQHAH